MCFGYRTLCWWGGSSVHNVRHAKHLIKQSGTVLFLFRHLPRNNLGKSTGLNPDNPKRDVRDQSRRQGHKAG